MNMTQYDMVEICRKKRRYVKDEVGEGFGDWLAVSI